MVVEYLLIIDGVMNCMKEFSGDEISISFVVDLWEEVQGDIPIYHHVDVCVMKR